MDGRYRFATDDDGHHFLIPADKREEWERWVMSDEACDGGPLPAWAESLGCSPGLYTFTSPALDRG